MFHNAHIQCRGVAFTAEFDMCSVPPFVRGCDIIVATYSEPFCRQIASPSGGGGGQPNSQQPFPSRPSSLSPSRAQFFFQSFLTDGATWKF